MKYKYSYLIVYYARTETGQVLGNIQLKTTVVLAYADLDETKRNIADTAGLNKENITILNIIPLRLDKKDAA